MRKIFNYRCKKENKEEIVKCLSSFDIVFQEFMILSDPYPFIPGQPIIAEYEYSYTFTIDNPEIETLFMLRFPKDSFSVIEP